jgi:hypothetical protein
MFPSLKKLRQSWRDYMSYDPEAEALSQASDQIEIEMIHRRFARQRRSGNGY